VVLGDPWDCGTEVPLTCELKEDFVEGIVMVYDRIE